MRTSLAWVLGVSLLTGCALQPPPPEQVLQVHGHELDQLFTDPRGNTIYRFYDQGDYRYYVVAPNGGVQMLPTTRTVTVTETDVVEVDTGGDASGGGGGGGHPHK